MIHRDDVKVSYSCMPIFELYIKSHNVKILANKKANDVKSCNCRYKETCPLQGNCLVDITEEVSAPQIKKTKTTTLV